MGKVDYAMFVRIVAIVFSVSAVTAFSFAMIRLMNPHLFYQQELDGSIKALHYFVCGLIAVTSVIGFLNSSIVMFRATPLNSGKNITKWLLFDSLFETARVLYLFICEVLLRSVGTVHMYDMILGGAQYYSLMTYKGVVKGTSIIRNMQNVGFFAVLSSDSQETMRKGFLSHFHCFTSFIV